MSTMDSFDDLLAPSRQMLEENPFDDPFANRSNSPDPWATPFSSSDPYATTPYDPFTPSDYVDHDITPTLTEPEPEPPTPTVTIDDTDPLDAKNIVADVSDEESTSPTSLRSPGFLGDIPHKFSETATIRPTVPEHEEPTILSPATEDYPIAVPVSPVVSPPSVQAYLPAKHLERQNSEPSLSFRPQPSPLERQPIHQSFSNLSIGGESAGWNATSPTWGGGGSPSLGPFQAAKPADTTDSDDDDEPIAKIAERKASAKHTPLPSEPETFFSITVDDPQKVGDPIRSYTMYTVHTKTNSTMYAKSAFSVLRRYSDFLWLYEAISMNNPGVMVPPVPEKNPFGRFDDSFVKQRRFGLEKCIQKIANHPVLKKDADLKLFLESDTFSLDIKHRKAEIANEKGGLIASIGHTLAGPRFHETDEWFDRQKGYLDGLEAQLRGLVKAIELVSKQRVELAVVTGEFAQSVSDLSASDVGQSLSTSLNGLADVERTAQELYEGQSQQDIITFLSTADEYARLISSVRLAFNSRIRMYHQWRNADAEVARVKQNHERSRAQGKIPPDRIGHALQVIGEAERRALDAKHEYEHVSKLVKSEMARFEKERIDDFKDALHAFLEGMISRQKELIAKWESYQQTLLKKVGGGESELAKAV